jgi:hypothetical protein
MYRIPSRVLVNEGRRFTKPAKHRNRTHRGFHPTRSIVLRREYQQRYESCYIIRHKNT